MAGRVRTEVVRGMVVTAKQSDVFLAEDLFANVTINIIAEDEWLHYRQFKLNFIALIEKLSIFSSL
jgi:hypothetical protein